MIFTINLFWEKIGKLPIAQNVLITDKETTLEEIKSFLHRAILCSYNTLFVIELNDTFSEYQQSIMNSLIGNLLLYKYNKYNEEMKENVGKEKTEKYLDSSIVFIYEKQKKNIISFLNEISKFVSQEDQAIKKGQILKITKVFQKVDVKINENMIKDTELKNILVITSDISGLGKSGKIKKLIKDNNQTYFPLHLGGILTKNIIINKLENLLNEIKNEINNKSKKYEDMAIHLDLTETTETTILKEFFFSFLITKFYKNNENIIYIPKDIHIYIEIPNCFEDYLSKFSILKIFDKENITIENMPPFNFPDNIISLFDRMLGIKSNYELEQFVEKYIGIKKYSYYQINTIAYVEIFPPLFEKLLQVNINYI